VDQEHAVGAAVETRASRQSAAGKSYLWLKRAFDVAVSAAGIAILFPFLPLIALAIKLDSKGSVFFSQTRLGKDGKLFTIYKFRTMEHHAAEIRNPDGSKFVGRNDPRLTRVGRFLRDASIDELPQLWNILKGQMSVVGPRPDTPGATGLDGEDYRRKRSMKPGLTSLASIHGRNAIPWKERIGWELEYIDRASPALDFLILCKTAVLVFRREGIYSPNEFGEDKTL
jgi:undecaprenyl phosphate N,N'-diacetylbacillosamine 1-phosphate transferase